MGVQVEITAYAAGSATGAEACRAAFSRIAELEDVTSDYRPASEVMRLCDRAGGPPVPVGADLFTVLQQALTVSERSNGAFDVTVGPYTQLWRQARRSGEMPRREEWRAAGELVGWRKVRLDPVRRTVQLLVPGMRLDLGGIAKGYALDQALAALREHGVTRALVHAGGDIAAADPPPGRQGWPVKVAYAGPSQQRLVVANCGVSSSGDTEQAVAIKGRRYSHIVDPRWGLRLARPVVATVIGPDGTTSDAWATAAVVLGERRASAVLGAIPDLTAYVRAVGG